MNTSNLSAFSWATIQSKLGLPSTQVSKISKPIKTSIAHTSLPELMQRRCIDGERTSHLTHLAGALFADGFELEECTTHCLQWNQNNVPPLANDKIIKTCMSIGAIDRINHPERYPELLKSTPLFNLQDGRIDSYLLSPPPARRWLLEDLVVLGKVGAVVAPGGSSKSQWMLQLAVSVATGIPLAEHWQVGETGGVLVLFAEDDNEEIHRRLHRINNHLQLTGYTNELATLKDRLFVFSTIGTETLLTKKDTSGEVSATVIVDRIAALAKQIPDLRLIVVDPCSRFRGGEENSNEDATRFVEALENLAKQTGASVMLAHHTSKGSYSNQDAGQGASRGASALTDGLRWQMNLSRPTDKLAAAFNLPKDDLSKFVAASVTKTNYSAIPAPVLLERGNDGYLTAVSPEAARKNGEQQAILKVMRVIYDATKPISARNLEEDHAGLSRPLKMSKQRLREVVKLGIARGYFSGGERKPLQVTEQGVSLLKCLPTPNPTANAPSREKVTARE